MTPKEKAKELFDKFMKPIDGLHKYPMCFDTAKQCALIAVDEVISADWYIPTFEDYKKWTSYWKEVKQEIEKL
jgi:hypothetical protein